MNILDSKDLQDRLNELTDIAMEDRDRSEEQELVELEDMSNQVTDWRYGATLIAVEDFPEYREELLKDCGDLPKDIPWYIAIDWNKTADNIAVDYSIITYQGQDYYYHN